MKYPIAKKAISTCNQGVPRTESHFARENAMLRDLCFATSYGCLLGGR